MILKGYTLLTEEEFKEALNYDEYIEIYTDLDTLFDVHGEYVDYYEVDYDDGNEITYSEN